MRNKIIIISFFSFFIFLRIIILDNDLPPRIITNILPFDELYYTIPAFNLYHYNKLSSPKLLSFKIKEDATIGNALQNVITYFTLLIFGNNYYGLRMSSVIISLFSILLLFLIFRKIDKDKIKLSLFLLFYFGIEFSFLIASRSNAPVSFRMFSLLLIVYISFYIKDMKKLDFILGFLSTLGIFFVYFHNIFIWFASLFAIIIYSYLNYRKEIYKNIFLFFLGTVVAVLLFNVFIQSAYHINIIDYFDALQVYTRRLSFSSHSNSFLFTSLNNIFNFFITNIFKLNISLFFIYMLSFPIFLYTVWKRKSFINIFILLLFLMLFGQSIFENSYYQRRLIIMLPIIGMIIYISVININTFIKNKDLMNIYKKYLYLVFLFSIYLFYTSYISKTSTSFTLSIGSNFIILNIFVFLIVVIFAYLYLFSKINIKRNILIYFYIIFLIPNFYLSLRYIIPRFNYKEAMIYFSSELNNEIIVGQTSFLFRLYNSSKPILNWYNYKEIDNYAYKKNFRNAFKEKNIKYTIDFYKRRRVYYLENLIDKSLKFKLKKSYLIDKATIVVLLEKINVEKN